MLMYRYIGNKAKLTPYILDKVQQMIGDTGTVADIMAGTGTVSITFWMQSATSMVGQVFQNICQMVHQLTSRLHTVSTSKNIKA